MRRCAAGCAVSKGDDGEARGPRGGEADCQTTPDSGPLPPVKTGPSLGWLVGGSCPESTGGPARSGAPPRGWRSGAREEPVGLRVVSRGGGGLGAGVLRATASGLMIVGLTSPQQSQADWSPRAFARVRAHQPIRGAGAEERLSEIDPDQPNLESSLCRRLRPSPRSVRPAPPPRSTGADWRRGCGRDPGRSCRYASALA